MKDKEIWQQIYYHDQKLPYMVSNTGKVISTRTKRLIKGSVKSKQKSLQGYIVITLTVNKKQYYFQLSRLVAEAFIPNPLNLNQVHHIDYNTLNNNINNLMWVNNKINTHDMLIKYDKQCGKNSKYNWDYQTAKYTHPCQRCHRPISVTAKYCRECYKETLKHEFDTTAKSNITIQQIQKLLYKNNGNFEKAAKLIGISSNAIKKRLKKQNKPFHSKNYKTNL